MVYATSPRHPAAARRQRLRCALLAGLALVIGLPLLALLLAGAAALQREPAVLLSERPDPTDVARAMALARAHDPRRATPGAVSALSLAPRDLELLLNHAAQRRLGALFRVQLERGAATLTVSARAPANPFGRWLNAELRLTQTPGWPQVAEWRLGRLPLPAALAPWLLPRLAQQAGVARELQLAQQVLKRVQFSPQRLQLVYAWPGAQPEQVLAELVPPDEQARLRAYSDRLAQTVTQLPPDQHAVSLAPLLAPMFELAQERSAAGGDAAAENRSAILLLALYAIGRNAESVLPAAREWDRARPLRVLLAGREDFPKHLLVSAAIAAECTGPLADAVGLYKEALDARGGSGYSFNDIAANRAGVRLGELALAAPRRLQALLAGGVAEAAFMPAVDDLPEHLSPAELQRRYGGTDGAGYRALMADIERRVAELALYRAGPAAAAALPRGTGT